MPSADPTTGLRDAAVLWILDGGYARVVDAAVACLLAGISTEAVDMLAGSTPNDPYAERLDLVARALDELGLDPIPADPDALARDGVRVQLGAVNSGVLTSADLGAWVTGRLTCETRARVEDALGHDGPRC